MIGGVARLAVVPVLLALASASAGASGARSPVALTASPAHLELVGAARATVRVTNSGTNPVVLDVRRAGFALDLRGRPKIVGQHDVRRTAAGWLGFRPRTLSLKPGATGSVSIASTVPARAEPGDHDALVLFTTRRRVTDGLAVRVRMGVVVVVRAPGRVVRRVLVNALRIDSMRRGRVLELVLVNRGNVTESFARGRAAIFVERKGRRLARLVTEPRELRPETRGVLRFTVPRRLSGHVVARVELVSEAGAGTRRTFRLRL